MKRQLWFPFFLILTMGLISCSQDGASMNEDYAGVWYNNDFFDIKLDMTDTGFVESVYADGYGYINWYKGTITKLSNTTAEIQATDEWDGTKWVAYSDTASTVTFSLSSDGHTLTWDGSTFTDTEPTH